MEFRVPAMFLREGSIPPATSCETDTLNEAINVVGACLNWEADLCELRSVWFLSVICV